MAYVDMSVAFAYKDLLTYQDMNQLGENDKVIWVDTKTRYMVISPAQFLPGDHTILYQIQYDGLITNSLYEQSFFASVNLPHGATIITVRSYLSRNDALATMSIAMKRILKFTRASSSMVTILANWTNGWNFGETGTISYATIDNVNYFYFLHLIIDNNDSTTDQAFGDFTITYTITNPLP